MLAKRVYDRIARVVLATCKVGRPIYSYFQKGCREKSKRQSRKALWAVLSVHCSSEKFERIGTKGHENVFASANGMQQK